MIADDDAAAAGAEAGEEQQAGHDSSASSSSSITRSDLGLPSPGSVDDAAGFQFLSGSECYQSEGIDDNEWFAEVSQSKQANSVTDYFVIPATFS